jgi:hypothetical protein
MKLLDLKEKIDNSNGMYVCTVCMYVCMYVYECGIVI